MNRCEALIPRNGMLQRCGDGNDLVTWNDHGGQPHYGCPRHQGGLKRRFPTALPERTGPRGTLGLGTPWTRGAFGPADIIEVENAIPPGYRINVLAKSPRTFIVAGILLDPDSGYANVELFRTPPTSDAYRVALAMADRLRLHAEGVHA